MIYTREIEGKRYEFSANFDVTRKLNAEGYNCYKSYTDIAGIEPTPDTILAVIKVALSSVNGSSEFNAEDECIHLIEQDGLQECQQLAAHILTSIMLGDVKKSELLKASVVTEITEALNLISQFENSWKAGSLWVATLLISGVVGGMTTMLF